MDGVGAATITEVSFQEKPVTKEEKESVVDPDTELSQLRDQLAELQQQKTELEGKKKRIAQKQELMEGYCNSLMDSSENTESEPMLKKDSIGMYARVQCAVQCCDVDHVMLGLCSCR